MPPDGYPAFLQYLQSGRVRRLESCPTRGMDTATRPGGMSMLRKAPEQSQLLVVLIVDIL